MLKNTAGKIALNIAALDIPKGQSFGLVGNNGAGKTTYFNLVLDLIQPTTGQVLKQWHSGEYRAKIGSPLLLPLLMRVS